MARTREAVRDDAELKAWNGDNQRRTHDFGTRALDLAARHARGGRRPDVGDVLGVLVRDESCPGNTPAGLRDQPPARSRPRRHPARVALGAFEEAEAFPRAVLEANPDRAVRGRACFALATDHQWYAEALPAWAEHPEYLAERGLGAGRVEHLRARDAGEQARRAIELFERVRAEFADVPDRRGRPLGARAEGELADFRGKVVVLTFSGSWCGPRRAAYPHERLAGRPFALVGVNTDEDPATLRRAIAAGEIIWRCWAEAGTDGPIVRAWGVSQFPTLHVLDPSGVIRHNSWRGPSRRAEAGRAPSVGGTFSI